MTPKNYDIESMERIKRRKNVKQRGEPDNNSFRVVRVHRRVCNFQKVYK